MQEPLLLAVPGGGGGGRRQRTPVSLLDLVPTALDWLGVSYPHYHLNNKTAAVRLTGRSLLTLADKGKGRSLGNTVRDGPLTRR